MYVCVCVRLILEMFFHSGHASISTTVWMHHLDSNETCGEKARWELNENAVYSFEQILEATLYKTAVVWSLTSHLRNNPSKTKNTFWAQLKK